MNGRALILLVMAVICGLCAMYGTSRMLSNQKKGPAVEMQDVLVAARDLKVEEMLKPEMVKVTQVAKSTVSPGTLTSLKDLEDRWVQIKILEGEPLVDRKLAPKGSPAGMVARIPKGMRAFTVEVNEHTGVSGFVLPDHRVDVVQHETGPNGKTDAETILQDVLVLASGQVFSRPDDRSIQTRTVTLAITPEQVDILVAAQAKGALTLALRGINDHESRPRRLKVEPKPEPVVAQASKIIEPPPPPPPPPPPAPEPAPKATPTRRVVYVYRGGVRSHRDAEKISIGDAEEDAAMSPGAFAGAKSEFTPPAN